eukprot:m.101381 g.101381  ORF g.101381 m.101381 type:complete len:91 (-) comp15454_c0_seq1:26-298(-)
MCVFALHSVCCVCFFVFGFFLCLLRWPCVRAATTIQLWVCCPINPRVRLVARAKEKWFPSGTVPVSALLIALHRQKRFNNLLVRFPCVLS